MIGGPPQGKVTLSCASLFSFSFFFVFCARPSSAAAKISRVLSFDPPPSPPPRAMVFPLSPSTSLANNTTRPGPFPAPSTAKKLSPPTVRFTNPASPAPAAGADDATSSKSGRARSAAPEGEDDDDEVDEVEDSEEEEGGAISMEFTSGDDGGRILGEPSEGDRTGATDEEHERREDDARSPSFVEPEALAPLHGASSFSLDARNRA